jgi:hypothetical protein
VASHPKKGVSSKRNSDDEHSQDGRLDVTPSLPLTSAWDDHVSLSVNGVEKSVLMPTLHMKLEDVARSDGSGRPSSSLFQLNALPYDAFDGHAMKGGAVADTSAQCLLSVDDMDDGESGMSDSYCAFIYEVRSCADPFRSPLISNCSITTLHVKGRLQKQSQINTKC